MRNALHSVWKSKKKSHSILRSKWATFTFWVAKSSLKMPKLVHLGEFVKAWCLWSNSVTRQVKNWRKMPKLKNSNATFLVIFIQCGFSWFWHEMVHSVRFRRDLVQKQFHAVHFYKMAKSAKFLIIIKKALSSLAFISTQWIDKSFQEVPKCLHLQLGDIQVAACTGGTQFYT